MGRVCSHFVYCEKVEQNLIFMLFANYVVKILKLYFFSNLSRIESIFFFHKLVRMQQMTNFSSSSDKSIWYKNNGSDWINCGSKRTIVQHSISITHIAMWTFMLWALVKGSIQNGLSVRRPAAVNTYWIKTKLRFWLQFFFNRFVELNISWMFYKNIL